VSTISAFRKPVAAVLGTDAESRAGDVLLLPIAGMAFWTLGYQFVLIARWPAKTVIWCFLTIAIIGFFLLGRLWKKSGAVPGKGYEFHSSHLFLLALGIAYAAAVLFVRRPNQDDVIYFHRALTQLSALDQPIFTRETSVDRTAAVFSPVHLATSYEMLVALAAHYLGIRPLYGYQVICHAIAAFSLPFVFYWCARRFGLNPWAAAIGGLIAIAFLLMADPSPLGTLLGAVSQVFGAGWRQSVNTAGWLGFSSVASYLWEGKSIVWILFLPLCLSLSYRFLNLASVVDLVWLSLLAIAAVGLNNSALYLIPAVIGCSWVAFVACELLQCQKQIGFGMQIRHGLLLTIPTIYPITILILLWFNIIPKPTDISGFGPSSMPWREAIGWVIGGTPEMWRDAVLLIAVPLVIVRGRSGLFIFFYLLAVWLLCLNPLWAPWWMRNILAYCYFRLVYLLQLPLLCALIAAAGSRLSWRDGLLKDRVLTALVISVLIVSFVYAYRGLSILPKYARVGIGWKSPGECQLLPANIEFANAAGRYIAHAKLLAPTWTASCELPLLLPQMKVVAPRSVVHYFANVGDRDEGILRAEAETFIESSEPGNSRHLGLLEAKFRKVIETGRADAVAVPEAQSQRVLKALTQINPSWHREVQAGGLVLLVP